MVISAIAIKIVNIETLTPDSKYRSANLLATSTYLTFCMKNLQIYCTLTLKIFTCNTLFVIFMRFNYLP